MAGGRMDEQENTVIQAFPRNLFGSTAAPRKSLVLQRRGEHFLSNDQSGSDTVRLSDTHCLQYL